MYKSTSLGHAGPTPDFVMRTGTYAPFNPINARRDISAQAVNAWTRSSVGRAGNPANFTENYPPPVDVSADGVAGFGDFGAPVPTNKKALWAYAGGAAAGVVGGLVAGGAGRRTTGAAIGALVGGLTAVGAVWFMQPKA